MRESSRRAALLRELQLPRRGGARAGAAAAHSLPAGDGRG